MALCNEMSYREGIPVSITTGKPLICHIKEGIMLFFFDDITDLLPLIFRGIDACRVVGTSV